MNVILQMNNLLPAVRPSVGSSLPSAIFSAKIQNFSNCKLCYLIQLGVISYILVPYGTFGYMQINAVALKLWLCLGIVGQYRRNGLEEICTYVARN